MPQAPVIQFPGIQAVRSATITRTHGISPNTIILDIAPQTDLVSRVGNLIVIYEGATLVIPDCIVDSSSLQFDTRRRIVSLIIFDRRWKWRFGSISGHYNRLTDSADATDVASEKSVRDLARLCLNEMGETNYDVSGLPDLSIGPEVEWECSNPARELELLCDEYSCRVVLSWTNQVRIAQFGQGLRLPVGQIVNSSPIPALPGMNFPVAMPIIRVAKSIDPVERPDAIKVCTAPIMFQIDMELEAVGMDIDGAIRPLKDLSFAPNKVAKDGGFADFFCGSTLGFFAIEDDRTRNLANRSIYKMYRVKVPFTFPSRDNNEPLEVTALENIRPLIPFQVGTVIEEGIKKNRPALVYGKWYDEDRLEVLGNTVETVRPAVEPEFPGGIVDAEALDKVIVPGGYSIDGNRCLVQFGRFMAYQYNKTGDEFDGLFFPAILYLRASFHFRRDNGAWQNYVTTRQQPKPWLGTKPQTILDSSIMPTARVVYEDISSNDPEEPRRSFDNFVIETNYADVQRYADRKIDAAEDEFTVNIPVTITYSGFFPIDLDGAIRMIEFRFDESGLDGITTTAFRDQDHGLQSYPGYVRMRTERRMRQILERHATHLSPRQIRARIRRDLRRGDV